MTEEREQDARKPASEDPDLAGQDRDAIKEGSGPAAPTFSARQIGRVRDVLGRLSGAKRAARFYPSDHPAVEESITGLMDVIQKFHDEGVDVPLTFFEDELLLGEQILPEDSVLFDQLIREMTSIGAGSVTFERGMDAYELGRAVRVLASDTTEIDAAGGLAPLIEEAELLHVSIAAVTIVEEMQETEGGEAARAAYGTALDLLRDLEAALRRGHALSGSSSRMVVRSLVENVMANRFAMLELAGLKDYDEYTFFHSVNVAILALALGSTITSDRRFLNALGAGALMHDVGKMTVAGQILNKPGSLSAEEWAAMRLHPVHGAELIATMPGMDKASVVVILEHHMRYDGRGYPTVRHYQQQHLASRIVAVADAFDAMTSRRSYSAARLPEDAIAVLVENRGTAFDERLVRLFVRMMGIYPPRSVVRLDTGQVAIVLCANESDATRPLIRVISGEDGSAVEPFDVDLISEEGAHLTVEMTLDPAGLNVDVDDYL